MRTFPSRGGRGGGIAVAVFMGETLRPAQLEGNLVSAAVAALSTAALHRAGRAGSPVPAGSGAACGMLGGVRIKLRAAAHLQILTLQELCESARGLVQSKTLHVA